MTGCDGAGARWLESGETRLRDGPWPGWRGSDGCNTSRHYNSVTEGQAQGEHLVPFPDIYLAQWLWYTTLLYYCEQLLKEFQETQENVNPLIKSVICGLKSCKKYLINRSNKKQMNVLMEETSVSVIRRPSRQLGEHETHSSYHCVPHYFLISAILASILPCYGWN